MLISIKNLVDSRLQENNTAYKARKYESETIVVHINKQDANILFTRKYNKFRVFFINTLTAKSTEISLYEAMDSIRYYLDGICLSDIAEELVGETDKPKSLSYMKRHNANILKIIMKHIKEL